MMKPDLKEQILSSAEHGLITTERISALGIHRSALKQLCDAGELTRISRGLYRIPETEPDDYLRLQKRYQQGIFSHRTALYLHGFTEAPPMIIEMTFPRQYHCASLKDENLLVTRVIPENYSLGITEVLSPSGNPLKAYDLERTLCDILRGDGTDRETIRYALKRFSETRRSTGRLLRYAQYLRVETKLRSYLEILL